MRRIEEYRLWVGHAGDARSVRELYSEGIRAVVALAAEEPPAPLSRDLIQVRVPLVDGAENETALLRVAIGTVKTLISEDIPTLVCCGAGMSRAPAIAAGALASIEGGDPDVCLERVTGGYAADVSPGLWGGIVEVVREG